MKVNMDQSNIGVFQNEGSMNKKWLVNNEEHINVIKNKVLKCALFWLIIVTLFN